MEILGISYPTLIRRVKSNSIPFVRVGKLVRFPRSYFEALEREAMESVKRTQPDA